MTYEDIGMRIKERRKELDISAVNLADRLGLSKATIHRYENGDIKNIKMPILEAMAEVLKVNPSWLLGKSEVKDDQKGFDVCVALDDIVINLKTYEHITCNGKEIPVKYRKQIILAIQAMQSAMGV